MNAAILFPLLSSNLMHYHIGFQGINAISSKEAANQEEYSILNRRLKHYSSIAGKTVNVSRRNHPTRFISLGDRLVTLFGIGYFRPRIRRDKS
jgi:hypothetical protein